MKEILIIEIGDKESVEMLGKVTQKQILFFIDQLEKNLIPTRTIT